MFPPLYPRSHEQSCLMTTQEVLAWELTMELTRSEPVDSTLVSALQQGWGGNWQKFGCFKALEREKKGRHAFSRFPPPSSCKQACMSMCCVSEVDCTSQPTMFEQKPRSLEAWLLMSDMIDCFIMPPTVSGEHRHGRYTFKMAVDAISLV